LPAESIASPNGLLNLALPSAPSLLPTDPNPVSVLMTVALITVRFAGGELVELPTELLTTHWN
jgi:hypothetical protein